MVAIRVIDIAIEAGCDASAVRKAAKSAADNGHVERGNTKEWVFSQAEKSVILSMLVGRGNSRMTVMTAVTQEDPELF